MIRIPRIVYLFLVTFILATATTAFAQYFEIETPAEGDVLPNRGASWPCSDETWSVGLDWEWEPPPENNPDLDRAIQFYLTVETATGQFLYATALPLQLDLIESKVFELGFNPCISNTDRIGLKMILTAKQLSVWNYPEAPITELWETFYDTVIFDVSALSTECSGPTADVLIEDNSIGPILEGEAAFSRMKISNSGCLYDVSGEVYIDGDAAFQIYPHEFTISPNGSKWFDLVFQPGGGSDHYWCEVVVASNDLQKPVQRFGVQGLAIKRVPEISVSPSYVDFSEVEVGTTVTRQVYIRNYGSVPGTVYSVRLGGSSVGVFGLAPLTTPVTLYPYNSIAVSLTFAPTAGGLYAGSLIIESDDPERPVLSVNLSGSGAEFCAVTGATLFTGLGDIDPGQSPPITAAISGEGSCLVSYQWYFTLPDGSFYSTDPLSSQMADGFVQIGAPGGVPTSDPGAYSVFLMTTSPSTVYSEVDQFVVRDPCDDYPPVVMAAHTVVPPSRENVVRLGDAFHVVATVRNPCLYDGASVQVHYQETASSLPPVQSALAQRLATVELGPGSDAEVVIPGPVIHRWDWIKPWKASRFLPTVLVVVRDWWGTDLATIVGAVTSAVGLWTTEPGTVSYSVGTLEGSQSFDSQYELSVSWQKQAWLAASIQSQISTILVSLGFSMASIAQPELLPAFTQAAKVANISLSVLAEDYYIAAYDPDDNYQEPVTVPIWEMPTEFITDEAELDSAMAAMVRLGVYGRALLDAYAKHQAAVAAEDFEWQLIHIESIFTFLSEMMEDYRVLRSYMYESDVNFNLLPRDAISDLGNELLANDLSPAEVTLYGYMGLSAAEADQRRLAAGTAYSDHEGSIWVNPQFDAEFISLLGEIQDSLYREYTAIKYEVLGEQPIPLDPDQVTSLEQQAQEAASILATDPLNAEASQELRDVRRQIGALLLQTNDATLEQVIADWTQRGVNLLHSVGPLVTTMNPPDGAPWYRSWATCADGRVRLLLESLPFPYTLEDIVSSSAKLNGVLLEDCTFGPLGPEYSEYEEMGFVSFDESDAALAFMEVEQSESIIVEIAWKFDDGRSCIAVGSVDLEDGPGFAPAGGHVAESETQGLQGIYVELCDTEGTLVQSTVTDELGYFSMEEIPNGEYSLTVVTPLGYLTEEETKEIVVDHCPVSVDFSLSGLEITPQQRSRGYWAHQLHKALQDRADDYTLGDFAELAGLINVHFNQNQINPVDFYSVPQPASQKDSLDVLTRLLHMRQTGDDSPFLKRLANAQLMALLLNVVSGNVSQTHEISADGRTISQAVTYCDLLVNDEIEPPADGGPGQGSPWCRYIRASYILLKCNLDLTVPADMIPEDVMQIAYRIHNEENLPEGFELHQNYPNPFNPVTELSFNLPAAANVSLDIFNIAGQKVATLYKGKLAPGEHSYQWDAGSVASGVYFYRLDTGEYTATKKMVLLK